jgi:hypothetical protein
VIKSVICAMWPDAAASGPSTLFTWAHQLRTALLAELVCPTGTVVTIELDDDLAAGAWDIACA